MSGHSHYATIKRQKETKDAQKGKLFSKLSKEIAIAVREGGGTDSLANYKLRMAMDRARASNMPKENVDRIISKAKESGEKLESFSYEGFGPGGVSVIVEVASDNRNRTGQELKNLFERAGGSLTGPGSVSFNFEHKGLILLEKEANTEKQFFKLIDAGVEEIEETRDGIEAYVAPERLVEIKVFLEKSAFKVKSFELVQKAKNLVSVNESALAAKILAFLESLEDQEDVQKVFANLNIPDEILSKLNV